MAFNLFRKVEKADSIFYNGTIHLMLTDSGDVTAIACKDGKVFAVGDYDSMSSIIGSGTEKIDLERRHLYPGLAEVNGRPAMDVFKGLYLDLTWCETTEDVLKAVSHWAAEHPDCEVVFGYGYKDDLKPVDQQTLTENNEQYENAEDEEDEESSEISYEFLPSSTLLSSACKDIPVVLLCESSIAVWINEAAAKIVYDTAEEEVVQVITVPYVLNVFVPFDFEKIEERVNTQALEMAKKGVTSVLNLGTPDYFEDMYQDALMGLYNESVLMQRFYGSYLLNRPLNPRALLHRLMGRRTNCMELGGFLNAETLCISLANKTNPIPFTQDSINTILLETANRDFNVYIDAFDYDDLLMAYKGLEHIRSKGLDNVFVIASALELSKEDASALIYCESAIHTTPVAQTDQENCTEASASSQCSLEDGLSQGYGIIGHENTDGTLANGNYADFAIFDEEIHTLAGKNRKAFMTVLGGKVVYDSLNE